METTANHIVKSTATPFTPVYLTRPGGFSAVPEHVVLCIVLNDETIGDFKTSFTTLRRANHPFMISFEVVTRFEEGLHLLIHSLCCLNYLCEGGVPVIAIPGSRDASNDTLNRLKKQGYHSVICWPSFDTDDTIVDDLTTRVSFPANAEPVQWLEYLLDADFRLLAGYVILRANDIDACNEIERALRNAWATRSHADIVFSQMLSAYVRARDERSVLAADNNKLRRQLKGTETTIGVIRTKYKDDYENLFAWYHNEYEILPLWYKRFGHILKVIMGKRTLRSLFSDDVKKYKT